MPRVKHSPQGRARRKKVLKQAKGNFGARSRLYKQAKLTVEKGLDYAFKARRAKKRDFRSLWIMRINAAVREHGFSYSRFMAALKKSGIQLNRQILSDMAVREPEVFAKLVQEVKSV